MRTLPILIFTATLSLAATPLSFGQELNLPDNLKVYRSLLCDTPEQVKEVMGATLIDRPTVINQINAAAGTAVCDRVVFIGVIGPAVNVLKTPQGMIFIHSVDVWAVELEGVFYMYIPPYTQHMPVWQDSENDTGTGV